MLENYQQVMAFFDSRKSLGIKPGLDRIYGLLDLLGNPQNELRAIHIAGTNGKGSTVQFMKNALVANGYDTGVFTSPSLTGLTGHISLNDTFISEMAFLQLLNEMYPAIKQLDNDNRHPTEFEIITALAFLYFSKQADIAIIEAGMGGREDTTNCFTPIMSIITNVAKDHTYYLGGTLKEIAFHKAGIIKSDAPVVLGEMNEEVLKVMETEITDKKTISYQLNKDFSYDLADGNSNVQQFNWKSKKDCQALSIQMLGEHQVDNASIAFMALKLLADKGFPANANKVKGAFKSTLIPGRFEVIQHNPDIILDGAHNLAGIEKFLQSVSRYYPGKSNHLIFAAFKDKDYKTMLDELKQHFTTVTVTTFKHPRAAAAEDLFHAVRANNIQVEADYKAALKQIHSQNGNYFITGSLHFIAQVRDYLMADQ